MIGNSLYKVTALLSVLLILSLSFSSCKKKTTEEPKYVLAGSLNYDPVSPIQQAGNDVEIRVYGVVHPEKKPLYVVYTFNSKTDTLKTPLTSDGLTFSVKMPDKVGSYPINIVVRPEDTKKYYPVNANYPFLVVNREDSYSGLDYPQDTFTDPRDGSVYPYFNANGTDWMCRNLSYKGAVDAPCGAPYYTPIMDDPWGRFYTFDEARQVCPEGWSLPGEDDFLALASYYLPSGNFEKYSFLEGFAGKMMTKAIFTEKRMWPFDPKIPIPDKGDFFAVPAGYMNTLDSDFDYRYHNFMSHAMFWTKDVSPVEEGKAIFRYLNTDSNSLLVGHADTRSMAMSVRCIRK